MRASLVAVAALLVAGCGGHRSAAPLCTLRTAQPPVPETGEHSLVLTTTCALESRPSLRLFGLNGARLPFALVDDGGPKGAHTVVLDKYRCDVRYRDLARTVELDGASLDVGRSLLDWCPSEAPSSVVHVYLGSLRRMPATWRDVLRDARDGRLDRIWPCGTLRGAARRLPVDGPMYSPLPAILRAAGARACADAIRWLPVGSPRATFDESLGAPDRAGPRCTVWKWAPAGGSIDGVRACFRQGRAVTVQTAVHG